MPWYELFSNLNAYPIRIILETILRPLTPTPLGGFPEEVIVERLRKSIFVFLLALISLGFTSLPQDQSGFTATNVNISYIFGQQITFLARLTSSVPIQQAFITFREVDEENSQVALLPLQRGRFDQVSIRRQPAFDSAFCNHRIFLPSNANQ